MRAGAGLGGGAGDLAAVLAELFAEPEPDREAVEVHQEGRPVRALPPDVRGLQGGHEGTLSELGGKHKEKLASLMTLNFQVFEDVSLLAA